MNWFNRLSIRARLTASFVLVAIIAGVIGAVGLTSIGRIHDMTTHMHDFELQGLYHVSRSDTAIMATAHYLRSAMLQPRGPSRDAAVRSMNEYLRTLHAEIEKAGAFFVTEEGQAQHKRVQTLAREYEAGIGRVLAQLANDYSSAQPRTVELAQREIQSGAQAQEIISQLTQRKLQNAQTFEDQVDATGDSTTIIVGALTVGGMLLALLLGFLEARSISRQLGGEPAHVAEIAATIAKGDLTANIDTEGLNPNSVMAHVAQMQASLRRLVGSVLASSSSIASGASQIAAGNTDLSQRTEQQAANLTETASAMEELAGTVQNNADVARQAAQRAMAASRSAEQGGEVVDNVVTTMAGINEASKRIVDIITVIDTIAFQTNILALNAAVEAARAGEQGRGFAVVASEVRSLAQKSASAAKDIKALIDDSVQKIEDGSRLVDTAGETMDGIVAEVKQVTDLISEISAATSEQTSGISQVNDAVLQLSDVTQQNAALVEESAAASTSLNEQAQRLVELVQVFRLENSRQGHSENRSNVISVPPATIEEGVRKTDRPTQNRNTGAGTTGAARKATAAAAPASAPKAAPARPVAKPAPALTGLTPALAAAGANSAAAGKSVYGPGTSKEDDWEEF